jgi:uncharacterized membrane protein YgcG
MPKSHHRKRIFTYRGRIVNRYFISGAIVLIIAMPTPVLALTIQNDLADQTNTELRYEFPANFREQIEAIEAQSGAKFYVYAGPYSPDDESLKRSPNLNAGANKAEQLGLSLMGTGDYDADRTTVIAWLRNQDNPAKGSVGVAPSITHRRAGATAEKLSATGADGLVIPELRRYMPQDPSGAIVAIATNLWNLQAGQEIGVTLGRILAIGVLIATIGISAYLVWSRGREILANKRQTEADREKSTAQARDELNLAILHLNNRNRDQAGYYQRLIDEPDVIKGMEAYLGDLAEVLDDLEVYRPAVTAYSSAYTLMGQFCLNYLNSDFIKALTLQEAQSLRSEAENLENNERRAQAAVDKLLVTYAEKYGGYIAYREESVADRQGHIPASGEDMIINPWTGEKIYRWGGITTNETREHLVRLSQADDWDSFRQFERLLETHRNSITNRVKLLAEIEAKALKIANVLDLWANYALPDREELVGEGTYYSPQDLIDYDAIAQTLTLTPPEYKKYTEQPAQLFSAGEFYSADRALGNLIDSLDRVFVNPAKRLEELMQMPNFRRREIEAIAAMQRQSARAAAAPNPKPRSSSSYSSYQSASPPPSSGTDWSSSSYDSGGGGSSSYDSGGGDWGGGGSYDSGAGGGDY